MTNSKLPRFVKRLKRPFPRRIAMRILRTVIVAAVVGVMVGAAVAYVEVRSDPDAIDKLSDLAANSSAKGAKDGPRIEVHEAHYDFGSMQRGTSKSHEFEIKSVGTEPLKIRKGGTTCKCTSFEVPDELIPPGKSSTVKLEWSAKSDNGQFRQSATLITNDPTHYEVNLEVEGHILAISGVEPADFLFDKLAVGETKSAVVYVMAMLQDDLTVKDPSFADPTVRDKFDVKVEPVDRAALPNKLAKRGVKVTVSAKPGLPIGRIGSWLSLNTNLPGAEKLSIPILGQVVGDISVGGLNGWNPEESVLIIPTVKSSVGGRGTANLVVRGPDAAKVEFRVLSKDPDVLNVKLGKPEKLKETLVRVPVEIEIPPNTPPMVHLDTPQGDAAKIVFSTTHPKIKEVSLSVRFAVER
jgi:hypothetical protein